MKLPILFILLVVLVGTGSIISYASAWIPPTNAYSKIITSNGTVYAKNYNQAVTIQGINATTITGSNSSKTIYINVNVVNGTNGTSGTTITPLTCILNSQLHSVSGAGVFTCAPNNSTGGSGTTLDTMQNIGKGGSGFYAGNSSNTNFQFRNLTSLRADLFIINHNSTDVTLDSLVKMPNKNCGAGSFIQVWTNTTGFTCAADSSGTITTASNVGTSGFGFFKTVTGTQLDFRNLTTTRSDLYTITQSASDVNLASPFKSNTIVCAANNFVSAFNNATGLSICGLPTATGVTSLNFTTSSDFDFRILPKNMTYLSLIGQVFNFGLKPNVVLTNGSAQTFTKQITTSTVTLGGAVTGNGQNITGTNYINSTKLFQGSNRVVDTINGLNGPTTNLVRGNAYSSITNSSNTVTITPGIATTNVVDVYDTTIGDYTKPSTANSSGDPQTTTIPATSLFTYDKFNETSGNVIDQCNNVVGTSCASDTGTQTVTGATQGVTGKLNNAINFTAFSNRVATGSSSEGFMHNQTSKFTVSYWFKKEQTPSTVNIVCTVCGFVFSDSNSDVTTGVNLIHKYTANKIMFLIDKSSAGNRVINATFSNTFDTNWHFVVLIWNYVNATNNACLSIDGGAYTCVTKSAVVAVNTAQSFNLNIGNRPNNDQSCGCALDEFAIFKNKVYSITEVSNLYNSGSGVQIGRFPTTTFQASNLVDGNTATEWKSTSIVHPWAYVDTASAQILSADALYPDKGSTTCLQILYQTSSDASTWTTKRTVNLSALTDATWNFVRWNLDTSTERYVRVYCNDAGATILALWEEKILIPSQVQLEMRHGHESISTSDGTVSLSQ